MCSPKTIVVLSVVLLGGTGGTASSATPARAPAGNDVEYCAQLIYQYERYVAGDYNRTDGGADLESQLAIVRCQEGKTADGIPVLERKLRSNGLSLPARR